MVSISSFAPISLLIFLSCILIIVSERCETTFDVTLWTNDEDITLDATLLQRLSCQRYFPVRFAFYLHELVLKAVQDYNCSNQDPWIPKEGHVEASIFKIPHRVLTEYDWTNVTRSDVVRSAGLHEVLPYDHVDIVLNALVSSKLFYLAWGRRSNIYLDLNHDWTMLYKMNDVIPLHERAHLLNVIVPLAEILPDGNDDSESETILNLIMQNVTYWHTPVPIVPINLSMNCIHEDSTENERKTTAGTSSQCIWGVPAALSDINIQLLRSLSTLAKDAWERGNLPDPILQMDDTYCIQANLTQYDQIVANMIHISDAHVLSKNDRPNSRILCVIYTIGPNHNRLVKSIRETWGKRCDGFLAMSNVSDISLGTFAIGHSSPHFHEAYDRMWLKVQSIWRAVATTFLDSYDYFLLGGDDMYVVVENLRLYLDSKHVQHITQNGRKPVYLGREFRLNQYMTFNMGGSGYILNAAALYLLNHMLDIPECLPHVITSIEDVMVAQCFRLAGVVPMDTSDEDDLIDINNFHDITMNPSIRTDTITDTNVTQSSPSLSSLSSSSNNNLHFCPKVGKERFHPWPPGASYHPIDKQPYTQMTPYHIHENCCSKHSISFQDMRAEGYMSCFHSILYHDPKRSTLTP